MSPDYKESDTAMAQAQKRFTFSKSKSDQAREMLREASILSPVSRRSGRTSRASNSPSRLMTPHYVAPQPMSWAKQVRIMQHEEETQPTSSRNRRRSLQLVCRSAQGDKRHVQSRPGLLHRRPTRDPRAVQSARMSSPHKYELASSPRVTYSRQIHDRMKSSAANTPKVDIEAYKKQVNTEVEIFPFWGQLKHMRCPEESALPTQEDVDRENFVYDFEKIRKETPFSVPYKKFYARIREELFDF